MKLLFMHKSLVGQYQFLCAGDSGHLAVWRIELVDLE